MDAEQLAAVKDAHKRVIEQLEAYELAQRALHDLPKEALLATQVTLCFPREAMEARGVSAEEQGRLERGLEELIQGNLNLFVHTMLTARRDAVLPLIAPAPAPAATDV